MSVWELAAAPLKAATAQPVARPQLTSVRGLRSGGLRFPALVVLLLAAGMVGLLALNVHIQNQQMALNKMQRQAAALALQVSDRQAQVYAKSGPGQLAAAASGLGMVPNPNPVYVDLRTGQVLGSPKAVIGDEMPALRVGVSTAPATGAVQPPAAQPAASTSAVASGAPAASVSPAASATPAASASPSVAASTTPKPTPAKSPTAKTTTTPKP